MFLMMVYDCDYVVIDEKTVVRLYVSEKGAYSQYYDDSHTPYIYAVATCDDAEERIKEIIKVSNEKVVSVDAVERVQLKRGTDTIEVLKVFVRYPFYVPEIRDEVAKYAEIYEYDIPYVRRYLMDTGIPLLHPVSISYEEKEGKRYITTVDEADGPQEELGVMSLDIETYCTSGMPEPKKNPIIMLSVASKEEGKVFCWKKCSDTTLFDDEKSMLEGAFDYIESMGPHVIVTYNGDNFDLPYIKKRCDTLGISHPFVTGMKIKGRGGRSSAQLAGIVHVDLYPIVRKTVNLSRYKLETVYKEYLGKDKSDIDGSKIWQYWEDTELRDTLARYSLEDAVATFEIGENLLPLEYELTKLLNQRLYDVARASSSSQVEWLLMKKCLDSDELVPNPPSSSDLARRFKQTYEGAYVVEPVKGVHEHIYYFDFRSLYPSIIITHNVDTSTIDCECCKDNVSPTGHCFCLKEKGFVPAILESLLKERVRIKGMMKGKEGLEHKSLFSQQWALKILANSFYGYLGYPRSRWYSKESAESITAWGRRYINDVIDDAAEWDLEVVYGDTDSLFACMDARDDGRAREFLAFINGALPKTMELEQEGYYPRGVFVTKKKYALIDEQDNITTKGLEVVRRDWTGVAKKTQWSVLEKILKEGDIESAISLVRDVTRDIKEGSVPIEDLVIDTQITMALSQYKSIGPHVLIAQKLKDRGEDIRVGTIISYLVLKGSGRIRDRAIAASDYDGQKLDAEYYIKNQVIPAVKRILEPLGYSEEDLEYSKTAQSNLEQWF